MLPLRPMDFLAAHQHQPPIIGHPSDWLAGPLQLAEQLMDFPSRPVEVEFDDHNGVGDLRDQVLDVAGPEVMTGDKVTLRMNSLANCRAKPTNPPRLGGFKHLWGDD